MNTLLRPRNTHTAPLAIKPGKELRPLVIVGSRSHGEVQPQPLARRVPRTPEQEQQATYTKRRVFAAVLGLAGLVGIGVGAMKVYDHANAPDCAFSAETKPVVIYGVGPEYAARQIDGIHNDSGTCVDEAIDYIRGHNLDAILTQDGQFIAGSQVDVPVSVDIKAIGDLFGG